MKNTDLILMIVDKSINAFGLILGLSEDSKLKKALSITQNTIQDVFNIDSFYLSEKKLGDILAKKLLDFEQAQLLTILLCTQAEILLKLNQPEESLVRYKNAVQLILWEGQQSIDRKKTETKKIRELETIISTLKLADKTG
jgi:hypothetical protein